MIQERTRIKSNVKFFKDFTLNDVENIDIYIQMPIEIMKNIDFICYIVSADWDQTYGQVINSY